MCIKTRPTCRSGIPDNIGIQSDLPDPEPEITSGQLLNHHFHNRHRIILENLHHLDDDKVPLMLFVGNADLRSLPILVCFSIHLSPRWGFLFGRFGTAMHIALLMGFKKLNG